LIEVLSRAHENGGKGFGDLKFRTFIGRFQSVGAAITAVKGLSSLVYIWKAVASACVQVAGRVSENWVKGHIKSKKSWTALSPLTATLFRHMKCGPGSWKRGGGTFLLKIVKEVVLWFLF